MSDGRFKYLYKRRETRGGVQGGHTAWGGHAKDAGCSRTNDMGVFRAPKHGHRQTRIDSATRKLDDMTDAQKNGQRSSAFNLENCASRPAYPKAFDNECHTGSSRIPPVQQIHKDLPSRHGVRGQQTGISRPRGSSLRSPTNEVSRQRFRRTDKSGNSDSWRDPTHNRLTDMQLVRETWRRIRITH